MMAEAIATLSLVCNVMQIISFTKESIDLYRRISTNGSPEPSLASNTAHLSTLISTLEERTNVFNSYQGSHESNSQAELAKKRFKTLASDIARDTKDLQKLLQKVTATNLTRRLDRLTIGLKYKFRYETQISSLEKRIDGTRNVLSLEFLSAICSSSQASQCRIEQGFSNLDAEIKQFIDRWSEGKRTISELIASEAQETRAHVTSEAEHTREQINLIDARLQTEASERNLEDTRKRVLSTLWFSEMNQRENTIAEASPDILNKIFPRSSFATWLQSDERIFWISGKPGSGKSTLMNHLIHCDQASEALRAWKPTVSIFRFYLFELGNNPLQRRLLGYQRTLLHQILEHDNDVLKQLLRMRPKIETKMSEHDWSLQELWDALSICLHHRASATCVFVDGLDEIQPEERGKIVDAIEALANIPNVKVCVVSRPENLFRQRLGSYPTLRAQDITSDALYAYAAKTLDKYKNFFGVSEDEYQIFLHRLVWKSEGVFLWTVIALKNLLIGVEKHGDSWELLNRRVQEFAPGLNDLFTQMWNRQGADLPIYKKQAAEVFRCVLFWPTKCPYALCCLLATHMGLRQELQYLISTKGYWAREDEVRICQKFNDWLLARTAGMVEAIRNKFGSQLGFIHRSAREFLTGTEDGQDIMKYADQSPGAQLDAYFRIVLESVYIWAAGPKRYFAASYHLDAMVIWAFNAHPKISCEESFRYWMPLPSQSTQWALTLLWSGAYAGDTTILDCIYQTKGLFEHIDAKDMSDILFCCCSAMFVPWHYGQYTLNSYDILLPTNIIKQNIDGIKWLINHGANPHSIHGRYKARPRLNGMIGWWEHVRINDYDTPFRMFLVACSIGILGFSETRKNPGILIRQYAAEILTCFDIFGTSGSGEQHDNILIEIEAAHVNLRMLVNVAWLLEILNKITDSIVPPEIIIDDVKWNLIQFHSLFRGGKWFQLAANNEIGKVNEVKSMIWLDYLRVVLQDGGCSFLGVDFLEWAGIWDRYSLIWEEVEN